MSDFEKITQAIHYIREHAQEQPTLKDVAGDVGLSEYHFQRVFSRWAGVTPKRYLQALTLERAKTLLKENHSTLAASYEAGLSSGSRLYDHFVQLEAVTPSEYKMAGEGLTIAYGYHETPYGLAFIAVTARGVCQLDFVELDNKDNALECLKKNWKNAEIVEDVDQTKEVVDSIFSYKPNNEKPLSVWVRGTNFQVSVWRALLKLSPGQIASYGDVAQAIGKPSASRAVGTAIGANPVGFIIPCHRVIRQSGGLGGYRWGEVRKQAMLARETATS